MKRSMLWAAVAVIAMSVFPALAGQPKYLLKYNHVLTERDPWHLAGQEWAKEVERRTNGEVKIEVYHSAQLGVEEDIIEQMRMGAPVAQNSDFARLGNYVKEFSILNLPYFVDNLEEVEKLQTSESIKKWKKQLEDEYGIHLLSYFFCQGARQVFSNVPVRKPEDLKGLRIRTAPAQAWQESVRSIGATPVAIPYVEIYSAIQTKACDGCELGFVPGYNGSFYEVCKYINQTNHILLLNTAICSAEWFNSLPPEYQKIIDEECDKAGKRTSYIIQDELIKKAKEDFKAKGTIIVEDLDMKAFVESSKSAYEAMGLLDARNAVWKEIGKM